MATKKLPTSAKKSATKSTVRKRDPHSTAAASAVDAQLARYRSMRDFNITAEPSGAGANTNTFAMRKPTTSRGLPFVIQKHAASHLHYDFRLGWNGVLKSGPSPKAPATTPTNAASPSRSKTIPWSTAASKASSPKASTAAAPS